MSYNPLNAVILLIGFALLYQCANARAGTTSDQMAQMNINTYLQMEKLCTPPHESPHFVKDSCWPYFAAKS